MKPKHLAPLLIAALAVPHAAVAAPGTYNVIWQFSGGADGASPFGRLLADPQGGFFGATVDGGSNYAGTVFHLTAPAAGQTAWQESTVYAFGSSTADGANPAGDLVYSKTGRTVFGTTGNGGAAGLGTIFRLDPPASGTGSWISTTLHSFAGATDGANPRAGLIYCGAALCGTAVTGGTDNFGSVFKLTIPQQPGQAYVLSVLYAFDGGADGGLPYAAATNDGAGGLLGTVSGYGGGQGGVFDLKPNAKPKQLPWQHSVAHEFFFTPSDGYTPLAPVLRIASTGVVYGTTHDGGAADGGAVYALTPGAAGWTETMLASFPAGCHPQGGLLADGKGGFLGTTSGCGTSSLGTVFHLTPPTGTGGWQIVTVHNFAGGTDGAMPQGTLINGGHGIYYGTTLNGGSAGDGTVFSFTL